MSTTVLLPAVLLAALAATSKSLTVRPECQSSCGGVDVPYPFGIGKGCFRPGFEIICNGSGSMAVLGNSIQIQVLNLSVTPRPEAQVMLPVAYQCYDSANRVTVEHKSPVDFNSASVYRISNTRNELFVLGCNTFVYTNSGPRGRHQHLNYAGCVAYANDSQSSQDGACAGVGCCHTDIPPGLTDNNMRFHNDGYWSHEDQEFCPCDYAFIVERDTYTFRAADLSSSMTLVGSRRPLLLDWAIREHTAGSPLSCAKAASTPEHTYTCVSDHSECVDSTNGPGYVCNCTKGYEGNPYLQGGCTNINECSRPWEFSCHGLCHDTKGSYDCECGPGYESNGDAKEKPCNPKFPLQARIALGISIGVFFLVVALLLAFIMYQKRKLARYFEMNGGNILKKVTGLTIFTEKDLNKITKNNSECLGNGFFGKVYKGTLPDKTVVAVKSFIKVDAERMDEFTEEVKIQLKMNHPNVLKLLGVCLQFNVPMLVYEFAANGSLRDILHINRSQKLSIELRLDIAIDSAKGLGYMHSEDIRHGDVKPDNILLNEKLIPKISDFGLSKLLKLGEKLAKKVVGCEGYMDPVFRNTGLLTSKSDVYSFGVVLLELISRKQIVYGQSGNLVIQFRHIYEKEKSGRSMFDEEIVTEEDILILEEIGKLAMKCLKESQGGRPDMTEVLEQLLKLRKNTVDDAASHNIEMSGTTDDTWSVSSSPISEFSKLLPPVEKRRRINLIKMRSEMVVFAGRDVIIHVLKAENLQAVVNMCTCVAASLVHRSTCFTMFVNSTEAQSIFNEIFRLLERQEHLLNEGISSTSMIEEVRTLVEDDDSWAIEIPRERAGIDKNTLFIINCILSAQDRIPSRHDAGHVSSIISEGLLLRKSEI